MRLRAGASMMHSMNESESILLRRRLPWHKAWVRVAGALLLAVVLMVALALAPGVILSVAGLLEAYKELAYPSVAGLALAAVACYATDRMRLARFLLIVLAFVMALTITLRFLYNPFVWAAMAVAIFAVIVRRFGPMVFWCSLAFMMWSPLTLRIPYVTSTLLLRWSNLVEVSILGAFVLWGAYTFGPTRSRSGKEDIRSSPYLGWLLLLLLGGCVAFVFGDMPDRTVGFVFLRQVGFTSPALYILVTKLVRTPEDVEKMMIAQMLGAMVMALFIMRGERPELWFETGAIEGGWTEGMTRVWGQYALPFGLILYVGGNTTAAYYATVASLALSLWLNATRFWRSVLGICVFALSLVMLVLTATRMIWIVAGLGFLLIAILSVKRRGASAIRVPLVVATGACVIAVLFSSGRIDQGMLDRVSDLRSVDSILSTRGYSGRVENWKVLWNLWLRNPFGLGFWANYPPHGMSAHNLYLMLGLSTGLFGLVAYVGFLVLSVRHWLAGLKMGDRTCNWICVGAIGAVAIILANGMSGGILWRFNLHISFWFMCSATTAAVEAARRAQRAQLKSLEPR